MTRTISAGQDLADGFQVVDGTEAVRQRVVQRLRLYRGEAFLAAETGVPYVQDLLGARIPTAVAGALIADAIRSVQGVGSVSEVDVSFVPRAEDLPDYDPDIHTGGRYLVVRATVRTSSGEDLTASTTL